ncbi:ATP-binding protein, partial [Saccharothrix sp. MB29]|nr:ATP-binding protein [Saccharothrix sp. MB29]
MQVSLRTWDDEIPVEAFAFGDWGAKPSEFLVECTVDGVRFEYLLTLDRTRVLYEALFHYPEKKRRRVFEREEGSIRFQRGLHGTAGTRELLTPRALVLSIARRFNEPLITRFADQL